MKKMTLILLIVVTCIKLNAQITNLNSFYNLPKYGDENVNYKVVCDVDSATINSTVKLMFYFSVVSPWYVYGNSESDFYKSLSIQFEHSPYFTLIDSKRTPTKKENDKLTGSIIEKYYGDFYIVYIVKINDNIPGESLAINTAVEWQHCDGDICNFTNKENKIIIPLRRKMKKSIFAKAINKHLKLIE